MVFNPNTARSVSEALASPLIFPHCGPWSYEHLLETLDVNRCRCFTAARRSTKSVGALAAIISRHGDEIAQTSSLSDSFSTETAALAKKAAHSFSSPGTPERRGRPSRPRKGAIFHTRQAELHRRTVRLVRPWRVQSKPLGSATPDRPRSDRRSSLGRGASCWPRRARSGTEFAIRAAVAVEIDAVFSKSEGRNWAWPIAPAQELFIFGAGRGRPSSSISSARTSCGRNRPACGP